MLAGPSSFVNLLAAAEHGAGQHGGGLGPGDADLLVEGVGPLLAAYALWVLPCGRIAFGAPVDDDGLPGGLQGGEALLRQVSRQGTKVTSARTGVSGSPSKALRYLVQMRGWRSARGSVSTYRLPSLPSYTGRDQLSRPSSVSVSFVTISSPIRYGFHSTPCPCHPARARSARRTGRISLPGTPGRRKSTG